MAVKFPKSTKASLHQRLQQRARDRWPQISDLRVRHHGVFTYVEAVLHDDPDPLPLCRIRYIDSAHHWHFAIYRASHHDYEESFFPTGLPYGTCQDALDTACGLYLNDPTTSTDIRPPTN